MFEVTARTTSPYSAICYILCTWADGTSTRASGVVVGANDVLTALHVVYNAAKPGGWATGIAIMPGADSSPLTTPYGSFTNWGQLSGRTTNWDTNGDGLLSDAEAQYDMALIGMKSRIGDVTGVLPVAAEPFDFNGTMVGYPARGTGMMAENVFADASSQYGVYDIAASLGAGASGGPLLHTSGSTTSVVGTLSSGSANNTAATYAGLFAPGNMEWLQNAMLANDSLIAAQNPLITGTLANDRFDLAATPLSAGIMLSDPGGVDTVVATGFAGGVTLNLATGTLTVGGQVVTVASGTVIENIVGGSGADTLTGNSASNVLTANAGNDTLTGGAGNDMLDGGDGIDTAVYTGLRSGYSGRIGATSAASSSVIDAVAGRDGTDTLVGVERVRFSDVSLALDITGHAGTTAKLLGAVFGAAAVANASYVGTGLKLLDAGTSYADLAKFALDARLGAGFTHAAEITLLYQNLLGITPSADQLAYYQGLLANGTYTPASLAVAVAEMPLNAELIGLTGLAATGLAYLPQG